MPRIDPRSRIQTLRRRVVRAIPAIPKVFVHADPAPNSHAHKHLNPPRRTP
ncbi:hypothetical protein ARMGADRAFT_1089394 [Armillaria gallica]|uniref:Uncharacterized protein n=1 Tax=Armillaria gallica TaxID=47427 RepID=A0A2H3CJM8_ARMGA|nr:hypothetical protein ARMGADRAFT_1089394 [Armillaria gallica]